MLYVYNRDLSSQKKISLQFIYIYGDKDSNFPKVTLCKQIGISKYSFNTRYRTLVEA